MKKLILILTVLGISSLTGCTLLSDIFTTTTIPENTTTTTLLNLEVDYPEVMDNTNYIFPVTGSLYSIGEPSAAEVLSLELINRARANPGMEGEFLADTGDSTISNAVAYFANLSGGNYVTTASVLINDFSMIAIAPPLAFNSNLNAAALTTSTMMRDFDIQDHTINGVPFYTRITDNGYSYNSCGENIYANSKSTLYGHAGFNIDWGTGPNGLQDPPGHRKNIMGIDNTFREIGICVLTDGIPEANNNAEGPQITAHEFGYKNNNTYFITGVIYNDLNGNQFYDEGEGLSGVTVSLENGNYYAVSSAAGAYTIPFDGGLGSVRIQATAANFNTQLITVALGAMNYKLDFNSQGNAANGNAALGFVHLSVKSMTEDRLIQTTVSEEYKAPSVK